MKMISITLDEEDKKNICSKIIETKEYLNKEISALNDQAKTLDQFAENIRIFVYGNTFINLKNESVIPRVTRKFILERETYLNSVVGELDRLSESYSPTRKDLSDSLKDLAKQIEREI